MRIIIAQVINGAFTRCMILRMAKVIQIENITHSICTLEFVPHRELYDWLIEKLEIFPSHQYEFARRNITYTVMSKRKLLQLVNEKYVMVGMTRECQRSVVCVAEDIHPKAFVIFVTESVLQKEKILLMLACLNFVFVKI